MNGIPASTEMLLSGRPVAASDPNGADHYAARCRTARAGAITGIESTRAAAASLAAATSHRVVSIRDVLEESVIPVAFAISRSIESVGDALAAYASRLRELSERERGALRDGDLALNTVRAQREALSVLAEQYGPAAVALVRDAEWRSGPPYHPPIPESWREDDAVSGMTVQSLDAWAVAGERWRSAARGVESAVRTVHGLRAEHRIAETELVAALARIPLVQVLRAQNTTGRPKTPGLALGVWSGRTPVIGDAGPRPKTGTASHFGFLRFLTGTSGAALDGSPLPPRAVADRWASLSAEAQERLLEEAPEALGNLPGLPVAVRDRANRRVLVEAALGRNQLSPEGVLLLGEITAVLGHTGPPVMLLGLRLADPVPSTILGYGDVARADTLTWAVPGMGSDASAAVSTWNRVSQNLYSEQQTLLARSGSRHAVVAFLGYDTPNVITVLSEAPARTGAARLATELDAVHAARDAESPRVRQAVLAHSYGTTTAALALARLEHPVQTFAMLGSAGLDREGTPVLSALRVANTDADAYEVVSAIADGDRLAPLGASLSGRALPFSTARAPGGVVIPGATEFSVEGSGEWIGTDGHSVLGSGERTPLGIGASAGRGYLDRGTQSLRNAAALTLGLSGSVIGGLRVSQTRGRRTRGSAVPGEATPRRRLR